MSRSRLASATGKVRALARVGKLALGASVRWRDRLEGQLMVAGLAAPARVYVDRWGVPHVYAASLEDVFLVQGFVHARDRLWQMEFQRRLGRGELAAILGESALATDRLIHIFGVNRLARADERVLTGEARVAAEAYVAGVNAYLGTADRLPLEFRLLDLEPRPWDLVDVLAWGKAVALSLSGNWAHELLRARLVGLLGPDRAAALEAGRPDKQPLVIDRLPDLGGAVGDDLLRLARDASEIADPLGPGRGSNAWAISAEKTATGAPILASDPHLGLKLPCIWYEIHLVGGDIAVSGASFPGSPGVVIGHNERIAWGVTNGRVDVQDLFVEQFEDSGLRYAQDGGWRDADVIREEIAVRGWPEPHVEEIVLTHHGPVVTPLLPAEQAEPTRLSVAWTGSDGGSVLPAVLAVNRASGWDEFCAAVHLWTCPPQNFVYADVDGNIGYVLGGTVPVRGDGAGRLPVTGSTGVHDWEVTIPPHALPRVLNPSAGVVVSANNRIVDDSYGYALPGEWDAGYRAARIRQLIEGAERHDLDSVASMQADLLSLPGLELVGLADRLPVRDEWEAAAREMLIRWDGVLSPNSVAASVYERVRKKLVALAYQEASSATELEIAAGGWLWEPGAEFLAAATPDVFRRVRERDDDWLPGDRHWDDVLGAAWHSAVGELRSELGPNVHRWEYRRIHAAVFEHPLGRIPFLKRLLVRGPYPVGGDGDTVSVCTVLRRSDGTLRCGGAAYRQVCDLADWDQSRAVQAGGQSGRPGSRHYADLLKLWRRHRYHPMLWQESSVVRAAATVAEFVPALERVPPG